MTRISGNQLRSKKSGGSEMTPIKVRAWDKTEERIYTNVLKMIADDDMWDDELTMWDVADAMETGDNKRFEFDLWIGEKDDAETEIYFNDIIETLTPITNGYDKRVGTMKEMLLVDEKNLVRLVSNPNPIKVIGNVYEDEYLLRNLDSVYELNEVED